jgi:hypothetical protein
MSSGGLTPIPGYAFYCGYIKQNAWGTSQAPTGANAWFSRWLDGTSVQPTTQVQQEQEGDAEPFVSLVYKKGQYWLIKVTEYARPITLGRILQACLRSGSDSYTEPTQSGTLAASVAVGDTSFESSIDLGNLSTLNLNVSPGYASTAYEVVAADLTSRSGAGPYTYTLAAGAKFTHAHASADVISTQSIHTLTPQAGPYDAFTSEFGYGSAVWTPAQAIRLTDSVCTQVDITSQTGMPLKVEHTWFGAASTLEAALATVTLEGSDVVGAAGGPLMHSQAGSSWTLDGASTGNAATIKQTKVSLKNSTNWQDFQSEGLQPTYFTPDNFTVECDITSIFQSYEQYFAMYYGSGAATTGATDSYLTGQGSLAVTWAADAINSLGIAIPNGAYTADMKLDPKRAAQPINQAIHLSGRRSVGGPAPITVTLTNSQAGQY